MTILLSRGDVAADRWQANRAKRAALLARADRVPMRPAVPSRCECGSIEMPVGAFSVIDSPEVGRSVLHTSYECEDWA